MTSHWPFSFGIGLLVWASLSASLPAQNDDPLTDRQLDFFEQEVRPLLAQRCLECHSGKVDPPAGGLRLDRRSGWQRGGELGPAIVPGQPDQSLLVEAIEPRSDRLQMPPDGRLSPAEIATLRRWIEAVAPDPRGTTTTTTVVGRRDRPPMRNRRTGPFSRCTVGHPTRATCRKTAGPAIRLTDFGSGIGETTG